MATEDPLALDYVAQQVGLLLLPTLTTRSTRAQAYAMVLYGLQLAERAVSEYGYPNTEDKKRELFERWERFWALATLEYRGGVLPRGDWDAMRGVRGAQAAWRASGDKLPLEFPLISRQQELGHLGAYLVPLRRSSLVTEGTVRPTPAAAEILDSFWDEAGENRHLRRYADYAFAMLEPERRKIDRSYNNLTLAKLGERSRLCSLVELEREPQQRRLYAALFERARDVTTLEMATLVETASKAGTTGARATLESAIAGRLGGVSPRLRELLVTAHAFGDYTQELLRTFDRIYSTVERSGWVAARHDVVTSAITQQSLADLQRAAAALLDTPCVGEIRRLPAHGAACLRVADELRNATAASALDIILAYHHAVQRDRRRGTGWLREDAGKLVLVVTSYTAHLDQARFPSFKLGALRTLLMDTGRLPWDGAEQVPEVGA